MAEQRVTGSSQRNAKDVAYELTELYYTTVVNKDNTKDVAPEEVAETYLKIYNKIVGCK
ncbi:hypothetical protein [Intestinibacter sp.]|uniref:hypothetical protein n=1 Tax=Intestinibacter sp. TaxID=1965304 RepID=UPI002A7596B7|nr:hypothetical protein [Intestinibacter sp.]MDY2736171.1 hypothetical protein [Intestinibacter sp.]MDY4574201.1 hypothetical protein [Intestinibacter sp.]